MQVDAPSLLYITLTGATRGSRRFNHPVSGVLGRWAAALESQVARTGNTKQVPFEFRLAENFEVVKAYSKTSLVKPNQSSHRRLCLEEIHMGM